MRRASDSSVCDVSESARYVCHTTATGKSQVMSLWTQLGNREKTRMKLKRYSANGTTHNIGTGATSVVRNVVTPSIRLDGETPTRPSAAGSKG